MRVALMNFFYLRGIEADAVILRLNADYDEFVVDRPAE